ncbi:MAG: iron ABC transporter permease [Alphaproteobacteria bacterium]|nr:iron ABC transporter permease [Alphaproteobacteria bacterium]
MLLERSRRDTPRATLAAPAALGAAVVLLFCVSLAVGPAHIDLLPAISGLFAAEPPVTSIILSEIRLPRSLLALTVGATLGLSGAALQGLLRNPLAEPGLVGVSATAALGAVVVFYFGLSAQFSLALPLGGITGAFIAVALLYGLAGREPGVLTLILCGVAVSSFAAALTSLALNLAPSPYAALEIVAWLLGSLADRSMDHVWLALPLMLAGWALLLSAGSALDALTLGEDAARTLGISLPRARLQVVLGTALAVGAAVSVTGGIAFVGLVVPHLLRPLVGYEPGRLLPLSALGGAALLLAADILVRLTSGPIELKLGVLTALVGAPFFLYLIFQTRRELT